MHTYETDRPTSSATRQRDPACDRAAGPGSGRDDPFRRRRTRLAALRPWRYTGTTGDAHGTRSMGRAEEVARSLPVFVKDLKRFAPGGLLFVVDFAKVENSSLDRLARAQPSILDDAEVAMSLAVLFPVRLTQKHRNSRMAECLSPKCPRTAKVGLATPRYAARPWARK